MHKSSVICKVPRKKSHDMGPLQLFGHQKDAKHDYLLAIRLIQNYTSAV